MKYRVVNSEVHAALKGNFELFLVYINLADTIDSDIDPVHNPDWRDSRARKEAQWLTDAQNRLNDLRRQHSHKIMSDTKFTIEEFRALRGLVLGRQAALRGRLVDPFPHIRKQTNEELEQLAPLAAKLQKAVETSEEEDILLFCSLDA